MIIYLFVDCYSLLLTSIDDSCNLFSVDNNCERGLKMYNDICEADYAMWCERPMIADCLVKLGLNKLAKEVIKAPANVGIISNYLSIIKAEAIKRRNSDVLNRLLAARLIYG